ncbi:LOW QUALITY PROTEIN: Helitron helicase [Phytophthora megakarya]|uniref:Helitron helicase n=1 Tax=Phytophthora megakarya TaxID=4795 RepID=A0A225VLW7_9STRA|nr:LOW QUALITY PROTEIN: Helitron helicase [Phytophthora megakarya]
MDIMLHPWQGGLERIFETRASYDPLQYPLLLPYGEPGWTLDLRYTVTSDNPSIGSNSLREYVSYLLHDYTDSDFLILKAGRLTQQCCVDQWAKLETLQGLTDALRNESSDVHRVAVNEEVANDHLQVAQIIPRGDAAAEPEASNLGRKVIIPPTFTGGPRYMCQCFLDAMTIVRETGAPNLFITMTCNPNWPEIKENLRRGEQASDRRDLVARVFMQKLKALNQYLDEGVLGPPRSMWLEYQKRGLTHAHILLIICPEDILVWAEDVDRLVSAELPDKENHPQLYETVISNMLHAPCGQQNPNWPCMKNGKCSEKFPKVFADETVMAEDKYPMWDNATINKWIVPYNPYISQKYNRHINVEVCATNKAVKYIYKYVYKGSDMTKIIIEGEEIQANEIL